MTSIRHPFIAAALLWAGIACSADVQDTQAPARALAGSLDASRLPIAIENGKLTGAGAARLVDDARHAQFVLVGEDHGFVEVPQFVLALRNSLGSDAPANLVLEIGPLSAARLGDAARDDSLAALSTRYPAAIPFFDWRDDGAMARAWQHGQRAQVLCGIDQEFILSTRMNIERLLVLAAKGAATDAVSRLLQRARAAERQMLDAHDPNAALLPQLGADDFAQLRAAVAPIEGSEAAAIIDELAASSAIYRTQGTDGDASNRQRSLLMKRHLMTCLDAATARGKLPPRALFRLGAYHAGRGLSPTRQYDIGNLASELAASRGETSVHILVIAAGGTVNKWLPFIADRAARAMPYDAKAELASVHAQAFLPHVDGSQWSVFDLRRLRTERAAREAGGAGFESLVFAYDYVVLVPTGHAARDYGAD